MRFVLFLLTASLGFAGEFSTSIGDSYPYLVSTITTDSAGNTYVVGSRALGGGLTVGRLGSFVGLIPVISSTISVINITLGYSLAGGSDVFVTKLDPTGQVLFTDTFAGKGADMGTAIALDPSGNIYIAGTTTSNDFPLSNALQNQSSTYGTGFIIKLTNDGSTILYSTYFGGTLGATSISSLTTDAQGNLYLTGSTTAADFPHTTGMPFGQVSQTGSPQTSGAIIASIAADGGKILYSGALVGATVECTGGFNCPNTTSGVGIGVDAAGNAYIAGNTDTTDLPATTGVLLASGVGAFVAKVNAGGTGLGYLTYLGSVEAIQGGSTFSPADTLNTIMVDAAGDAYLAGSTSDINFPTTPGSFQPGFAGGAPLGFSVTDGFIAKLNPDGSAMLWATYLGNPSLGPSTNVQSMAVDASGNVWATGTTDSSTFPNTNGWSTGPEFLAGLNAAGSKLTYSALYPSGTVAQSVALDPSGLVHVAGANGFVSTIAPTTAPPMGIFDFQNIAAGNVTARISPAEVISIFGPGIGPATAAAATPANGFYPKTLAGVQVTINGMNMPLLYVSANQINAVVPMGVTSGAAATVHVINGATTSPDYPVWIVASAPQAFPAVLNQDGTVNSGSNPAKAGSIVTFDGTGWQSNFSPLADGQVATTAQDVCLGTCQVTSVDAVNLSNSTVLYGGAAPGIVAGVTQFNVLLGTLPESAGADGISQVSLYLTGPPTQPAYITQTIYVAP